MSLFTDNLWRMRIVKPITLIIQHKLLILLLYKTSFPPTLSCSACILLKSWLQMVQLILLMLFLAISAFCTFWLFIVQHFLCFSTLCKGEMLINVKSKRENLRGQEAVSPTVLQNLLQDASGKDHFFNAGAYSAVLLSSDMSQDLQGNNLCKDSFSDD